MSVEHHTVCPRSSDPSYVVTYYIKWVNTSWTYSIISKTMTKPVMFSICNLFQGIPREILLESSDSVRGRAGLHLHLDHGPQPLHGHGSDRLYR